jgi:hypothetical protein
MAAEATRRRGPLVVVALVALVGLAATGLVVTFRGEASATQERASADGQRLRATFAVAVEDTALAGVSATLRLTNTSPRPAWFFDNECIGPEAYIGPSGLRPRQGAALEEGSVRDRLIAAGEATLRVDLGRADGQFCDAGAGPVRVEPDETLTWELHSGASTADRSSDLLAVALVREVTRTGRSVGRLRLEVPFPELSGAQPLTPEQAVGAFLAHPVASNFLAATGDDGVLTVVAREGDVWQMSIGASNGNVSAEVHQDLSVTDIQASASPELSTPG